MGNWTHLTKIGVRPAHGRAPVARTEQAHYAGVGGWFCPGCYDTAVAPTRCSTCEETMLPRGRALMVPRDTREPSRVGVALRYVGVAVGVALVFSAPFVFGSAWGSRSYAGHGHMLTALLVLLALISTLVGWAWWSQSGGARRAGSATRWLERHHPEAPALEDSGPSGYPAQRADWGDLPAPPNTDLVPNAPAPNGAEIIRLREEAADWRAEAASIDVDIAIPFFIGGLAVTAGGAFTGLWGLMTLNGDMFGGGFIAAGVGLVTWITSLIIWRVNAHRQRRRERRAEDIDQQLHRLLGGGPVANAPAIRF